MWVFASSRFAAPFLQLRSMNFIKDVARQLRGAIQQRMKTEGAPASQRGGPGTPYGSELVDILEQSERKGKEGRSKKRDRLNREYTALRLALCFGSANKIAQRMANRNGYKTVNDKPRLVEVHLFFISLSRHPVAQLPHDLSVQQHAFLSCLHSQSQVKTSVFDL